MNEFDLTIYRSHLVKIKINPNFAFVMFFIFVSLNNLFAQRPQPVFSKHIITNALDLAKKFSIDDIDNDGDLDIASVASNTNDHPNVIWFENNGFESFTSHIVADTFYTARGVYLADVTNNGYPDILVGGTGRRALTLYMNDGSPANGGWTSMTIGIPDCTIYSISSTDFDGDGNLDIVATYSNARNDLEGDRVRWFKNNGDLTFTPNVLVSNYETAAAVCLDDFDKDGYTDIITAAFGESPGPPSNVGLNDDISWWENNGSQVFQQHSLNIPTNFQSPTALCRADVNNDGYPDILAAAYFGGFNGLVSGYPLSGSLAWWANDQNGGFGTIHLLISDFTFARSISGGDMDGDGDTDVLGAADEDNRIIWLENDGSQNFSSHLITSTFSYAYFAGFQDLDGDGDADIIGSAQNAYEVSWWENHQEDDRLVAADDPDTVRFWGDKVIIDFNAGTQDSVTVFYNAGKNQSQSNLGEGIDHIAQKGFYTITTRKTGYAASLDFYYGNVAEWGAVNSEEDLVISWWDEANMEWIEAGTSQVVSSGDQKITVNGISSTLNEFRPFSKWAIGSRTSDNPLPVQLLAFSAEILSDGVKLNWSTASEINNLGFEIWRSEGSDSGYVLLSDYRSNENLIGAGNSNELNSYSYSDLNVRDNFTYRYKLIDVDVNNQKEVHGPLEVTFVRISIVSSFQLGQNYPNPFNGYTKIPIYLKSQTLSASANGTLQIFNLLGQQIRSFDLDLSSSGLNVIQWDGKDDFGKIVASGQYYYRVDLNGESQSRKLILIR